MFEDRRFPNTLYRRQSEALLEWSSSEPFTYSNCRLTWISSFPLLPLRPSLRSTCLSPVYLCGAECHAWLTFVEWMKCVLNGTVLFLSLLHDTATLSSTLPQWLASLKSKLASLQHWRYCTWYTYLFSTKAELQTRNKLNIFCNGALFCPQYFRTFSGKHSE